MNTYTFLITFYFKMFTFLYLQVISNSKAYAVAAVGYTDQRSKCSNYSFSIPRVSLTSYGKPLSCKRTRYAKLRDA